MAVFSYAPFHKRATADTASLSRNSIAIMYQNFLQATYYIIFPAFFPWSILCDPFKAGKHRNRQHCLLATFGSYRCNNCFLPCHFAPAIPFAFLLPICSWMRVWQSDWYHSLKPFHLWDFTPMPTRSASGSVPQRISASISFWPFWDPYSLLCLGFGYTTVGKIAIRRTFNDAHIVESNAAGTPGNFIPVPCIGSILNRAVVQLHRDIRCFYHQRISESTSAPIKVIFALAAAPFHIIDTGDRFHFTHTFLSVAGPIVRHRSNKLCSHCILLSGRGLL